MLAAIRSQQKILLIIVAAIVIVAFAWLYNKQDYGPQAGNTQQTAFSVYGRPYRISEARRLIRNYSILQSLGLNQLARTLFGERLDEDATDFAINLTVFRKQSSELGVKPSLDAVNTEIRNLPAFNPNGAYDASRYQFFIENYLAPNGMTHADLEQLVSDSLSYDKMLQLFRANVLASPEEVNEIFDARNTKYKTALIEIDPAQFNDTIKIAPDELKKYYEENKDKGAFQSEAKRRIEYVFFERPQADPDAKEEDKLTTEERTEKEKAIAGKVQEFFTSLVDGATLDEAAKQFNTPITKTEAFTISKPPEELSDAYALLQQIARATLATPVSEPVSTSKGYYIFRLLEVVEPKPLPFEEAKDKIAESLTTEKTSEAAKARAEEVQAKIEASLKGGQTIAAAAKAAGVTADTLEPFSMVEPPEAAQRMPLLQTVTSLTPGEIKAVTDAEAAPFLVYLESKQPPAADEGKEDKEQLAEILSASDGAALFRGWFQQKIQEAEPKKSVSFSNN